MRKLGLYFMVFGIFFIAFDKVGSGIKNENLGDYYSKNFAEVTVEGKKLVYKDTENTTYYVTEFNSNGEYVTYGNVYLSTSEDYFKTYNTLVGSIISYDYANLMIKYVSEQGTGNYYSYLSDFINANNAKLTIVY